MPSTCDLVVEAPPGYEAERRHVLDAVLSGWWGCTWRLETRLGPDVTVRLGADPDGPSVRMPDVLFATTPDRWLTAAALPQPPLPRLPVGEAGAGVLGADERLPVLYGRPGAAPPCLVEADERGARLHVDVFGSAFAMLTRYEEAMGGPRDSYGRYPASSALAVRDGFIRLPIVDAYAELLWAAMHGVWPRLRRRATAYEVVLSHDVDDPLAALGRTPALVARQFAGDLVRRRDPGLAMRRARSLAAAARGDRRSDPNNTFDLLMDVSDRHGLRSAFYFLARTEVSPRRPPYDLLAHPWVRGLVGHVHRRGHEVGLHAGFGTHLDPERTAAEFTRLRAVADEQGVEQEVWGGRQHYLQWANPVTWRNWEAAGLAYDCTLGFSEAVGFRTGTSRAYRAFDLVERRALNLVETPFQVMDVALYGYLGLTPDAAAAATLEVARACHRFAGTLGILWHNDEVLRTAREKRWYAALVAAVTRPA